MTKTPTSGRIAKDEASEAQRFSQTIGVSTAPELQHLENICDTKAVSVIRRGKESLAPLMVDIYILVVFSPNVPVQVKTGPTLCCTHPCQSHPHQEMYEKLVRAGTGWYWLVPTNTYIGFCTPRRTLVDSRKENFTQFTSSAFGVGSGTSLRYKSHTQCPIWGISGSLWFGRNLRRTPGVGII